MSERAVNEREKKDSDFDGTPDYRDLYPYDKDKKYWLYLERNVRRG